MRRRNLLVVVRGIIKAAALSMLGLSLAGLCMADDFELPIYGELASNSAEFRKLLGSDPRSIHYLLVPDRPALRQGLPERRVVIGIVDSGVNPDHPQLASKVAALRSFTDAGPEDSLGHGTAVAIGASANVAAMLFSAKVTDSRNRVSLDAVIAALDWLEANKVELVNMSLAFDPATPGAERLCKRVAAMPALIVAAAGNRGPEWRPLPASCGADNVLTVASDEETSGVGDIGADRPVQVDRASYLLETGRSQIRSDDLASAQKTLGELLQTEPNHPEGLYLAAAAYFKAGRTDLAWRFARDATTADPKMAGAFWLLALTSANLADREGAIAALDSLTGLEPAYPKAKAFRDWLADADNALPDSLRDFFGKE